MRFPFVIAAFSTAFWIGTAQAAEIRIGEPVVRNGMQIGALYIQAVKMDMGHGGQQDGHGDHGGQVQASAGAAGHDSHGGQDTHHAGTHAVSGDLHLEAAVTASADNDWGFPEGVWIPYLTIEWTLEKRGSDWRMNGTFLPMAASEGPHYGDNLNLDGPGKYTVTYRISPPDPGVFPRHFDKETGVSEWWAPFEVTWDFVFTGTGKKGGY